MSIRPEWESPDGEGSLESIHNLFAAAGVGVLYQYWKKYAAAKLYEASNEQAIYTAAKWFLETPDYLRSRDLRRFFFLSQDNLAAAIANRARVLRVEDPNDSKHSCYPEAATRSFHVFELLLAIISQFTDKRTRRKWLQKPRGEIDWVKPYAACHSDDPADWEALLNMAIADLEKFQAAKLAA